MAFGFLLSHLLLAAIPLTGVTGERLRARAFFDANNVKVGDPLVLTVDFVGKADFASLHPPALARHVDRRDWKVDDASAKTDTFNDARRLTYRLRPMREGVLWFPELDFAYTATDGSARIVHANAIPVHARAGADVVVEGMRDDLTALPDPDALVTAAPEGLTDDERFAWRKACAKPTADAFAAFDFPAAKMNEARCAMLEGDARRALKVYRKLEWRIGQTPELERGYVAALARLAQNPLAELPVWRQVGRPLLRYDWKGRIGLTLGSLAGLVILFVLMGKAIRRLACLALTLLLVLPAAAQFGDPFAEMEEMMRQHREQMQRLHQQMGTGMNLTINGFGTMNDGPIGVKASLSCEPESPQVGENFTFVITLESPKNVTLDQLGLGPSQTYGLAVTGPVTNLPDAPSANPSNAVRRLAVPVRYDIPYAGPISFTVRGMAQRRIARRGFTSSVSTSFETATPERAIRVRPLPSAGQPDDFTGAILENPQLTERADLARPGTNDVVCLTYRLVYSGFLPEDWMLPGAAFELGRGEADGRLAVEWRRFFVADGTNATPRVSFSYYDPKTRTYRRLEAGGRRVTYQ